MAKIINFPGVKPVGHHVEDQAQTETITTKKRGTFRKILRRIFDVITGVVILILGILWTPIEWLLYLDCFIQLLRAIYYWNTPGVYAWLTFLLHFGGVIALTLFITSKIKQPAKNFSR